MDGAEGALHDAGNDGAVEQSSNRQPARDGGLTDPAKPPESVMKQQALTPRQGARSSPDHPGHDGLGAKSRSHRAVDITQA